MKNKRNILTFTFLFIIMLISPWMRRIVDISVVVAVLSIALAGIITHISLSKRKRAIVLLAVILNVSILCLTLPKNIDTQMVQKSRLKQDMLIRRFDYYSSGWGKIYMNRYAIFYHYNVEPIMEKYARNLFENMDINLYFFASHPRERGDVGEFAKLSFIFLPLFLVGLFESVLKNKTIVVLFLVNLFLSALYLSNYYLGPVLLFAYISFFIALGFSLCIEKTSYYLKNR